MKTSISTSILTSLVLSAVLTVIGLLFCRDMLTALATDPHILEDAGVYLMIYMAGLLYLFLYNICTGIFTALGDSRTPLYFLIASSVANIVLDMAFVTVGGMGVDGVAWATFLAQGVSSILAFFTLLRRLKTIPSGKFPLFQLHMFAASPAWPSPAFCSRALFRWAIWLYSGSSTAMAGRSSADFRRR